MTSTATTTIATRPVRALVGVAQPDDLDWRIPFIAALRAQSLVWGGEANLLVPIEDGMFTHPAFWAIAQAADPDAVLLHSGSWGDVRELDRADYERAAAAQRAELAQYGQATVDSFLADWANQPWPSIALDAFAPLVARCSMLHHEGRPEFGFTDARSEIGYPWVDVLDFPADQLPQPIADLHAVDDLNFDLLLAGDCGQLSAAGAKRAAHKGVVVSRTDEPDFRKLVPTVYRSLRQASISLRPFELARVGCSWFSHLSEWQERVAVVVGDSPWDFAVAYALRRMTGAAFWMPTAHLTQQIAVAYAARLASDATSLAVTSVSAPADIKSAAQSIRAAGSGRTPIEEVDYAALFPRIGRRLQCVEHANRVVRFNVDPDRRMTVEAPVPSMRTSSDPTGLHWMVDIRVADWAVIHDSYAHAHLVPDSSGFKSTARTLADGVSVLCPNPMVFGGLELEAQVPHPEVWIADVTEQIAAIGTRAGYRCAPSDKGVYTLEAADLVGGLPSLMDIVGDPRWLTLLRAMTSAKQSGHPGHWSPSDKRRYFDLSSMEELVEDANLPVSTTELVRRGLVRRGLRHHCPRCRFTSWFDQAELSTGLRCARCRRDVTLSDSGWEGSDEPRWNYRVDEFLWQFISHHGDLALRGVREYLIPVGRDRRHAAWGLGVEMDIFRPNGRRLGETDLTVILDGALWLGEAKSNSTLGSEADARAALRRLKASAEHLRADGVLLLSQDRPFSPQQQELARAIFAESLIDLRTEVVDN